MYLKQLSSQKPIIIQSRVKRVLERVNLYIQYV